MYAVLSLAEYHIPGIKSIRDVYLAAQGNNAHWGTLDDARIEMSCVEGNGIVLVEPNNPGAIVNFVIFGDSGSDVGAFNFQTVVLTDDNLIIDQNVVRKIEREAQTAVPMSRNVGVM